MTTSVGAQRPPLRAEPSDPALFWRKTKLNVLAHWVEEADPESVGAVLKAAIEAERKSNAGI